MSKERIQYLLHQYAINKATKDEVEEMFVLLEQAENKDVLKNFITSAKNNAGQDVPVTQAEWDNIWNVIQSATFGKPKTRVILFNRFRTVAAILILAVGTTIFFIAKPKKTLTAEVTVKKQTLNDVPPGGNRAVLTLADGSSIVLDSAHNGSLAQQGSTKILKMDAGQLSYNTAGATAGQVLYNTIATPRGGQFQVTLADGTQVWLNAASSLRFPTAFTGSKREVELEGEAYFEVAKNAAMPFHVKVKKMDVQVLGTHFNIMAYDNEQSIKTTLLEGRVKVSNNGMIKNIEPGQQAELNSSSNTIQVKEVNTDLAIAWKNGLFHFRQTNIHELMRQVERWYDVDVEYKTPGNNQDYTGIVQRSQNVSALLRMLELTGTVHFKVEGRKITVLP